MRRISSLDGLRALAAALVVAAHLASQKKFTGLEVGGAIGVHLFFVLSGYLITTLLLEEEQRNGTVSLKKFWLRRCWRILPAYFAYIVVLVVLDYFNSAITLTSGSLAAALTFTTGWRPGNWELGHLWSLAVEMQFYVMWPLAMRIRDSGGRWAVALLLMIVSILGRVVVYRSMGPSAMLASVCNFDSISAGCLLGLLLNSEKIRVRYRWEYIRHAALPLACISAGVMMWLSHSQQLGVITVPLGNAMLAVALTLLVLNVLMAQEGSLIYRVLNSRLLVGAGTLSYSVYLWQQVVLRPEGLASVFGVGTWLDHPAISLALIGSLAVVSYFGLERSFASFRSSLR